MENRNDGDDSDDDQERDDNGGRPGNNRDANNGLTAFLQITRDQQQLPLHPAPPLPDRGPAGSQQQHLQSQSQTVSTQEQTVSSQSQTVSTQEQSQQPGPGPSGLQSLINPRGIVGGANSGGDAASQSSAGAMPSLRTPAQPRSHPVFEISPSQGVFSSQDPMFELPSTLSHSSLQPGGSGHPQLPSSGSGHLQPSSGPPQPSSNGSRQTQPPLAEEGNPLLPLLLRRQQQQQSAEWDNSELMEAYREWGRAGGEGSRVRGGAGGGEGGQAGAHQVGNQVPPYRPPAWQQRVMEDITRNRAKFVAKVFGVPGNSDSGQSSDELSARRTRIREELSETSVPNPPPSNLTVGTAYSAFHEAFHEAIMTASSDSSSSEAQVPGGERKESTRHQKVPRISGMRQLKITQESRAAEAIRRDNPPDAADQPVGESSVMETETENSLHQGSGEQESHESSTDSTDGERGGLRSRSEGGRISDCARGSHQSAGEEEGSWSRGEGSAAASRGQESQPQGAQRAGGIPMTMSEGSGSSPAEREGTRNLPRPPETLSEPGEYHSRSQPRVRRGAVQRWRHGVGYSSSEDTEESHFQQRATAAPPTSGTSGTDTDITTEYAGTQTTSSSASAESDSASFTTASTDRQSASADSDVPSQTLPLNSTPEDSGTMRPPAALRMLTPKRKRSSDETMTSISTTTSSSSGGLTEKYKAFKTGSASLESIAEADIPAHSQEPSFESLEQTPFVLDSQSTLDEPRQQPRERDPSEVIPNTPPEGELMDQLPAHTSGTCQELFQESQDLANQLPRWCDNMAVESQGSSSSSSEHSRSPALPPPKRRKIRESSSSSDMLVKGSREGSSTRSSLGPSMQAQPSSIPSSLAPGLKQHDSRSHSSSSKSGSIVKHDGDRVGSGSGSSSSSYVCSSASSGGQISQEISSSSGGGSAEGSLNRSMSSDGLSGSSGSKGGGLGSQKGSSGSSNGGHDADVSTISSLPRQTPPSLESEDLGESEGIQQSESESCLKTLDTSAENVAAMSSSGSVSGSTEAHATLSTSVPAAASVEVIEDTVPDDVEYTDAPAYVAPVVPVPPAHVDSRVRSETSSWPLSSSIINSRPLDSHAGSQPSVSREKPSEPPLSEQGDTCKRLEEISEVGVEQQTLSELLPEMPGSPELLQTVCWEGIKEEEEHMHDSPEIDLQAPVNMPPPRHGPPQHIRISSSTPDQSHQKTSGALSLLAASSSERAEPMEADFSHEGSTQNSFALHWSPSQASALTPSGIPSPYQHSEPNTSQASLKPCSISFEGLEEIEDHEREFPNLVDKDRQQQQSLERSVGEESISESQKQSDRSETSLTSSSSQSGKSGSGPDSTPPEDGGGGGGADRGGGRGGADRGGGRGGADRGGGGGGADGGGGGGVGGSVGGSGEGGESEYGKGDGDGAGDERSDSSQPKEKDDGKKESEMDWKDSLPRQRCNDLVRAPTEPTTSVIRVRPVPTYESLQCEGSAEGVVLSYRQELPGVQPAPSPALISEAGQEGGQGGVNSQAVRPPTAESQHSLEISQLTPSGTPFHFQLPQGGLLRPRVCITPPSQRLRSSLPSPMDSNSPSFRPPLHAHVPNLRNENGTIGSVAMLSPSELNCSLFRPITPSQSQQSAGRLESQNPVSLVSSEKQSGDAMEDSSGPEPPAFIAPDAQNSPPRIPPENERLSVPDSMAHCSEMIVSGVTQPSETPQQTSRQQSVCTVNNLATQPTTITEAGNGSSGEMNREQNSPQEPGHLTASQSSSSSSKNSQPSVINTSTRQQVTTPTSPRKSLSLRKVRNSPAPVKVQSTTSQPVTKPPNDTTGENTGTKAAAGFLLGVHSLQSEMERNVCESQLLLPAVTVPSDSQFEPSESSQFSPATFRIERPPNQNHQASVPPPSVASRTDSNVAPSKSIFSSLKTGMSSRKKTSGLATAVSSTNRNYSTRVYEFDSQNQESERTPFVRNSSKRGRGKKLGRGGGGEVGRGGGRGRGEGGGRGGGGGGRGGKGGGESRECVNSESAVNCSSSNDQENGSMEIDDAGIPDANPVECGHPPSPPLHNPTGCSSSQDGVGAEEAPSGASSSQSDVGFRTVPTGQAEAQAVPSSSGVNSITTTNLSQHQHAAANPLPDVSSSSAMEPTSSSVASPCSLSVLRFTSPSAVVSSLGLEQLVKQQTGGQRKRYELQYVMTYRTVLEHRVLSSQVIEDGQVVGESEKVWQVPSEPTYSQEEALHVISPDDPTTLTSPSIHILPLSSTSTTSSAIAANMMSPTILQPLQSPATTSLTSIQSPSTSFSMGLHTSYLSSAQTGSTTPQVHPQASLPPVRLVKPVLQSGDSSVTSPRHQQVAPLAMVTSESQSPTDTSTGTVHAQVQDTLLEENPIPSLSTQTHMPVSTKLGSWKRKGRQARKEKSGESLVTKRIQTRSGGKKLASPPPPPSHDKKRQAEERATTPQRRQTRSTTSSPSKSTPLSSPATRARGGCPTRGKSASPWQSTPHTRSSKPSVPLRTRHEEPMPGPSGTNALPSSSHSVSSSDSPTMQVGRQVVARWSDKHWYLATVTGEIKNGKCYVTYADGDKANVSVSNMFPVECVREDVPVTALSVPEEGLPEVNGLFSGFVESERKRFKIAVNGGEEEETCWTSRMTLPPESAHMCLQCMVSTSRGGRKRRCSSSEGERSVVKKRRISISPRHPSSGVEKVLPPQWSLFEGYSFLLTQRPKDEASPPPNPVDKDFISSEIRSRRGKILNTITNERIIDGRFFVVADTHCRTVKYLLGLALAVPCVSYDWVKECIEQGCVVDYRPYRLPAGVPLGSDSPVQWQPRSRSSVLRGVNVYIAGSDSFKHQWSPILHRAGATHFSKLPSCHQIARSEEGSSLLGDMVVICEDKHRPNSLLRLANKVGMKLLNPQWIVQCLIQGKRLENYRDFWFK